MNNVYAGDFYEFKYSTIADRLNFTHEDIIQSHSLLFDPVLNANRIQQKNNERSKKSYAKNHKKKPTSEEIIKYITDNSSLRNSQLSEALGVSCRTITRYRARINKNVTTKDDSISKSAS